MSAGYYRVGTYYVDVTTPTAPVLYRCITAGDKTSSAWARVTGAGTSWQTPKKELDPTVAVAANTFVYVSPQNPLVTTGLVDLVSGVLTTSRAGIWQALQAVPVKNGMGKYNVPQVPYPGAGGTPSGSPLAGDADSAALFWILWSPVPYC